MDITVMVALIAAGAALFGSVAGAGAVVFAAHLQSRRAADSTRDQWRRTTRRDAYAALTLAARRMRSPADDIHQSSEGMQAVLLGRYGDSNPGFSMGPERIGPLRDAVAAVTEAAAIVEIEGPAEVAELATTLATQCQDLVVYTARSHQADRPLRTPELINGIEATAAQFSTAARRSIA
ncbi:hypothetical protein OH782_42435 (plasmid) [Streptomyces sp. NBC_01544]|uniref:hypothetical protein n=1 Tax=Streptomyces sp. NBC_01544 TaxID=2975871 RepID=UPI002F9133B6